MSTEVYIIAAGVVVAIILLLFIVWSYKRKTVVIKTTDFTEKWIELQKNCATRKTWPIAIIDADDLLFEALKKNKYKGKTTGEKLVAAQRDLSDNEGVWFGHKLRKTIENEDVRKIKKQDVKDALTGFRQALRDLGALEK